MNRKRVHILILCFSFMLISVVAYAEKPPPPPQYGPPPPGLPIDGGLSFLLISGAAFGIFALKRKK